MDIRLSDEQRMLQSACARLLTRVLGSSAARRAEYAQGADDGPPPGRDIRDAVWAGLREIGVLRITLAEAAGGEGLGQGSAIIVSEQMGRMLWQSPYPDTVTAADVIEQMGPDSPHRRLLPLIGSGTYTTALAVREDGAASPADLEAVRATVGPRGRGDRLRGSKRFVPFAREVDAFVVAARATDGPMLALVPRVRDGVDVRRHDEIGRGDLYTVTFRDAPMFPEDVIAPPDATGRAYAAALARARIRHAAYLVGLAQGAFDLTLKYTKERRQFGQAIAAFQSVAFRLAALVARIDAARLLTHYVAWRSDRGDDIRGPGAQVAALAADLARDVTAEALQLHGAFGFTEDAEPQRYYRRAVVDAMLLGTPSQLRAEAAALLAASHEARDLAATR